MTGGAGTLDLAHLDIGDLAHLTQLIYLDLGQTYVTGNIGDLAHLTKLTYLDLRCTHVTGNRIGVLAHLTQLSYCAYGSRAYETCSTCTRGCAC